MGAGDADWSEVLGRAAREGLLPTDVAAATAKDLLPTVALDEVAARTGLPVETLAALRRRPPAENPTLWLPSPVGGKPLGAGDRLGRFEILGLLGRGGMGVVYRARDPLLGRVVALKTLLIAESVADPIASERFQREARAAARLHHPAIVPLFERGETGGTTYFTMELVEGKPFSQALMDGALCGAPSAPAPDCPTVMAVPESVSPPHPIRLPWREALPVLVDVARALEYAHSMGVIHRDVKPQNIFLDAEGRPHLSDFGLARELAACTRLTRSGTAMGTPAYMPPEQALGEHDRVGPWSDVYSLGAILYEVVAGRPPFDGKNAFEILLRAVSVAPRPPRELCPDCPAEMETVCLKALEKDPAHRYQTATEFAADLERLLRGQRVEAKPVPLLGRAIRAARRNYLLTAVLVIGVAVLFAMGFSVLHGRAEIARETERVASERRLREAEAERVRADQQRRLAARKQADEFLDQAAATRGEVSLDLATRAVEADPEYVEAYLQRARVLETLSKFDLLIADLSKAIELNPLCVPAYLRRAWAYDDYLYEKEKASKDYQKVVELCPNNDIGYLARAKFNLVQKNYGEAEVDCNKAIQLNPNNAMAYATRAFSRWLSDQPKKALDDYRTALKMDPEAVRAYITQTLLSFSGRKPSTKLIEMTRGIQADPESHMAKIVNKAFASALEEQWIVTLKCTNQIVAEMPEAYWAHLMRGAVYENARMHPMALTEFNWCIQKDPTLSEAFNLRAWLRYKQGQYAQAIPDYEKAIACEPTDETSHNMRGWCLTRLGRKDEARKEFDTSLAIAPRSPRVRIERGEFFEQTGDHLGALEEFGKATEFAPADPRGYISRAGVFLALKRFPEAEAEFDKALALDPEDPRAWQGRARAYYDHGQHEKAIGDFKQCLKLAPNDDDVWNWLGCSHFAIGKYEESFEDFHEAWRRAPKSALYASNAASALALGGKHARAIEMFDAAFQLNANDPSGYNWRAFLWVKEGKYANAARDALRMAELTHDPERRREAESLMRRSEAFERTGKLPQVPRVE